MSLNQAMTLIELTRTAGRARGLETLYSQPRSFLRTCRRSRRPRTKRGTMADLAWRPVTNLSLKNRSPKPRHHILRDGSQSSGHQYWGLQVRYQRSTATIGNNRTMHLRPPPNPWRHPMRHEPAGLSLREHDHRTLAGGSLAQSPGELEFTRFSPAGHGFLHHACLVRRHHR